MLAVICLDERDGMSFHGRRLSRDRAIIDDLVMSFPSYKIWIHPYSAVLFSDYPEAVIISEDYLQQAKTGELCFVELDPLKLMADSLEGVIVYRWNRHYPADQHFDLTLSAFRLVERYEFSGSSHDRITKEVYMR